MATRAIVLVPITHRNRRKTTAGGEGDSAMVHSPEDRKAEATGLAQAIDLDVRQSIIVPLNAPRPSTLLREAAHLGARLLGAEERV